MDNNANMASRYEHEIPEGYEARIEGNKVIIELKESEDERIIGRIKKAIESYWSDEPLDEILAWLEKQGQHKPVISDEAIREGVAHFGITQYQISNWLKKYIDIEKQGSQNLANSEKTCKVEQNPAWSKKDEYILEIITFVLQVNFEPKERFSGYEEYMNVDLINWLKTLKERYTWKPSDEQMKLLREVQQALLGKDCHNRFVNFMCDLKKLKG